jgi:hypothetical protein
MNPAFTAVTRRKYLPVGSAPASLRATVTTANTEFMSSEFAIGAATSGGWYGQVNDIGARNLAVANGM